MANFKEEIINSYTKGVEETSRLFLLVPVDVEKMNFQITPDTLVMHELIRHLQQLELYAIRGILTDKWEIENIPWYVGKNIPMCDQLKTNHSQAMKYLENLNDEEFFLRNVKTELGNATLAQALLFYQERIAHYRTLLYVTLKMLGIKVVDMEIWS